MDQTGYKNDLHAAFAGEDEYDYPQTLQQPSLPSEDEMERAFEAFAGEDDLSQAAGGMKTDYQSLLAARDDRTTIMVRCKHCGRPTESTKGLLACFGSVSCQGCIDEWEEKQRAEVAENEIWKDLCPPRYAQARWDWKHYDARIRSFKAWRPKQGSGIAIMGDTGRGKTCLAMLIAKELCLAYYDVGVIWSEELIENALQATRKSSTYSAIKALCKPQVIVLDDPLLNGSKDKRVTEFFSMLIDYCQRWHKSLIITSQLTGEEYAQSSLEGFDKAPDNAKRIESMRRKMGQICKEKIQL